MTLSEETEQFLIDLKENNNRSWFNANKAQYQKALNNTAEFSDALLVELKKEDKIETLSGKKALFRIYRDVRFSKDKSPYKNHFAGGFKRATNALRGGYYFHLEPKSIFVAGGFWGPNKEDLLHIRKQIQADPQLLRNILSNSQFIEYFKELKGETLKTAPKGFNKNDPSVDLLRFKQFLLVRELDSELFTSTELLSEVLKTFKAMRPFFDYMSEILTTDLNGESIIE
jgi:uncharacterized protein (TIGR02453 family)